MSSASWLLDSAVFFYCGLYIYIKRERECEREDRFEIGLLIDGSRWLVFRVDVNINVFSRVKRFTTKNGGF